jgi:alpha-tubulin suppressor-like RCC1 family protein
MGSIDGLASGARRRVAVRRWLARGLVLVSVAFGLMAVGSPALAATPKWLTVSAGDRHTCAIKVNTTLWCWGSNDEGQLGVEGVSTSDVPIEVGGDGWSVVSAGYSYTCGIRNGRRYCWGDNKYGQLGLRGTLDRSTPVAGPGESNNWLTISADSSHTCGLRTSGLAQCWGSNGAGQLGIGSSGAIRDRPTTVVGGITWSAIDTGNGFTCGIDVSGRRYCWGGNNVGQLGLGLGPDVALSAPDYLPGDDSYVSIEVGYNSACAVTTSGRLACWGSNDGFKLGIPGGTRNVPTLVAGNLWQSVSVDHYHACGVRLRLAEMTAMPDQRYCWGMNGLGQLGDGTTTDRQTPQWVNDGRWRMVSTGSHHSCGISAGQYLYCWGSNGSGRLGVGKDVVSYWSTEAVLVR